jgi:BlaR1 peptidase M56
VETLLRIGLSNAVAALLLALVVVTIACIWRRPAVLHALWLLVLLKLVTPPLLWLPEPWPVADPGPALKVVGEAPVGPAPAVPPVAETKPADPAPDEPGAAVEPAPAWEPIAIAISDADAAPSPAPMGPPAPNPVAAPTPAVNGWAAAVFGVWLAGSLGWYALAVYRLQRFRRLLRHAVPAPESLRQRTQRLAVKLKLRRCPTVWLIPGRVAPMLWAAGGQPRILFPVELLGLVDVEQQNALLVHELAHLRRRDHWVRWLEFAAAGLYWWNPVLWFARRELREAEEQCCDAWVTSTLPGAGKSYATALLETLDFLSDASPATPSLACGVGRVSDLKRD